MVSGLNPGMRIYLDLDETLVGNLVDKDGRVIEIFPRPGSSWFLRTMAQHGDLWLLTAANREHARQALRKLGPEAKRFKGILTREDMKPVEDQIAVALETPGVSDDVRLELWDQVKPIAPPGVMFDDFPVGSSMWALKSKAIGISKDEHNWIQVESFYPGIGDRQGLRNAYSQFVERFGDQGFSLGRRRKVLAWR